MRMQKQYARQTGHYKFAVRAYYSKKLHAKPAVFNTENFTLLRLSVIFFDLRSANHLLATAMESDISLHKAVRLVLRCSVCNLDYFTKEGLWDHLDTHEEISEDNKEVQYEEIKVKQEVRQCTLCTDQRAYAESSFWNHVQDIHDGYFLQCSQCGEKFRSDELQNDHYKSCSKNDDQTKDAIKKEQIADAMRNEYSSDADSTASNNTINQIVPGEKTLSNEKLCGSKITKSPSKGKTTKKRRKRIVQSIVACEICDKKYTSKAAAYFHIRNNHEMHKCVHCRKQFPFADYKAHKSVCKQNRVSCKLCDTTFKHQRYLSRHMKIKHKIRKIVKREPKEGEKYSFACGICGKLFLRGQNLHYHQKKDHGRNNKCPYCRGLFFNDDYQDHLSACEKKMRITCELCQSKYRNSQYLARHMKRVHMIDTASKVMSNDETEVKPDRTSKESPKVLVKCLQCEKKFAEGKSMKNHVRNFHTPAKCTICDINFYGMERFRYHRIAKHTEPTFKCDYCPKKFHWKNACEFHMSICNAGPGNAKNESANAEELLTEIKIEETMLESTDDAEIPMEDSYTSGHNDKLKSGLAGGSVLGVHIKEERQEDEDI